MEHNNPIENNDIDFEEKRQRKRVYTLLSALRHGVVEIMGVFGDSIYRYEIGDALLKRKDLIMSNVDFISAESEVDGRIHLYPTLTLNGNYVRITDQSGENLNPNSFTGLDRSLVLHKISEKFKHYNITLKFN